MRETYLSNSHPVTRDIVRLEERVLHPLPQILQSVGGFGEAFARVRRRLLEEREIWIETPKSTEQRSR